MWPQVGRLLVCLLGTCVSVSLGLNVNFDRTPDSRFCAQLRCGEVVSQTDEHIAYLIGLSVYNITLAHTKVKLAYVSLFDPDLYIEESKVEVVNGTGSLTRNQGRLALSFQDVADCLHGKFLCELDFINVSNQPDSVSESTSSGDNDYCGLLDDQLRVLAARVDNLTSDTQTLKLENLDLQSALENVTLTLKLENLGLQSALENVTLTLKHENLDLQSALVNVTQRLAKLEGQDNTSISKPQVPELPCYKGMPSNTSREEFLLWDRVPALCDTETDGGGWVVIQRRTKGDVDFYRNWTDYKNGFGTPDTDFWIGLDVIHNLTSHGYNQLRFDLMNGSQNYFENYSDFIVADELSKYRFSVGAYNGTAGDSFADDDGSMFGTYDSDNDVYWADNCPSHHHGAWWYKDCTYSNLNGKWGATNNTGIFWHTLTDFTSSLTSTEMKVRQV